MEDAGGGDEEFETAEERMAWLRARGVRIEEPGQASGPAPSGQGRSFIFVRIPVAEAQTCEELDGPHCNGDALPTLLGPRFAGCSLSDEELRAYAAGQGQAGVDLAVLRKLVMQGRAESFRLAVPTAANGREGVYAYLDEASELKGLAVNERASAVARCCGFPSTCRLRGDVYIGRLQWSDGGIVENADFHLGELQPGAPWMQRAVTENLEFQKTTQPEQHEAAQDGGDPDQRAEGVGDGYVWKDDGEELEVLLDVPESTSKRDVKIEFRRQEVRVSKPTSLTLKLFKNVEVDGCSWTMGKPGFAAVCEPPLLDPELQQVLQEVWMGGAIVRINPNCLLAGDNDGGDDLEVPDLMAVIATAAETDEPPPRCPPLSAPDPANYPDDLAEKAAAVRKLLAGRLEDDDVSGGLEVVASPEPLHYRHRVKFELQHDGDCVHYAVFDPSSMEWLTVEEYPLASHRINRLMSDLRAVLAREHELRRKAFQVELLSTTGDEALACILYHRTLSPGDRLRAERAAAALDAVVVLRAKGQRLAWPARRSYLVQENEIEGKVYPQWLMENGFFQANLLLNREMQSWVTRHMQVEGEEARDLLEMYCGNGNFTLPAASNFRRVLAAEIDEPAVRGASICAKRADIDNVHFRRCRAESLDLESQIQPVGPYDFSTVLVDPPRSGLDNRSLKMVQNFERLIYVSCNPRTLARDLDSLQSHRWPSALSAASRKGAGSIIVALHDCQPERDKDLTQDAVRPGARRSLNKDMPVVRKSGLDVADLLTQECEPYVALKNWLQRAEVPLPTVRDMPLPSAQRAIVTAQQSIKEADLAGTAWLAERGPVWYDGCLQEPQRSMHGDKEAELRDAAVRR
ncbi:trmA [Symbiodinium pilosum]|uniref:TrmA protein n=1 Tax=Symbiodinium pilosum TaxID=2952 RepID=A0A812T3H4_SYMPI|nr:trmA [Symbiodinium pilosum]